MRRITIETDDMTIDINDKAFSIRLREGKTVTERCFEVQPKAEVKPYPVAEKPKEVRNTHERKLPMGTCVICGREYQKTSNVQRKCRQLDCKPKFTSTIDPIDDTDKEEI